MNNNIKQEINKIITAPELSNIEITEKLVSVRDILVAYKNLHETKQQNIYPIIRLLQKNMPYLDNIIFYKNILDKTNNSVILWLKFNRKCPIYNDALVEYLMLKYENGNLSFLNPTGIDSNIKTIINKDKDLYSFLAKYAIENKYNIDPIINTISNNFKLNIFDDTFTILLNNTILEKDKHFKLIYAHDTLTKGFETEEGIFKLDTNIGGLDKYFSNKGKRVNPMSLFLEHLKVYEKDLPNHIKVKRI